MEEELVVGISGFLVENELSSQGGLDGECLHGSTVMSLQLN